MCNGWIREAAHRETSRNEQSCRVKHMTVQNRELYERVTNLKRLTPARVFS